MPRTSALTGPSSRADSRARAAATLVSAASEPFLERRFELTPLAAGGPPRARLPSRRTRAPRIGALGATTRSWVGRTSSRRCRPVCGPPRVVTAKWWRSSRGWVGKSRLVFELARSQHIAGVSCSKPARCPTARARAISRRGLLRRYFGIEDRDTHAEIRDRVVRKLAALDSALQASVPPFLMLLTPHRRSTVAASRSFAAKEADVRCVKRLLRRKRDPAILVVFEDLHWIDSETSAPGLHRRQRANDASASRLDVPAEYQHPWPARVTTRSSESIRCSRQQEELLVALLGDDSSLEPSRAARRQDGTQSALHRRKRSNAGRDGSLARAAWRVHARQADRRDRGPETVQAILAAASTVCRSMTSGCSKSLRSSARTSRSPCLPPLPRERRGAPRAVRTPADGGIALRDTGVCRCRVHVQARAHA